MSRFERKTVIIAGGGGAIGRASAVRLAAEGARVVCLDIAKTREESARLASESGAAAGGSGYALALDAGDPESVKAAFAEAISRFGPIEALVNSIGFGSSAKALEVGEKEFEHIFDLNLKSVYRCSWAVLPHMRDRRSGKIVNLSSVSGRTSSDIEGPHVSSSKAAVIGLTRQLAHEFGTFNINVNVVAPGLVATERVLDQIGEEHRARIEAATPLRRIATAEDVAALVAFIASEDARHITGATVDVNGGLFLA
jgi:NAD(P)-dependent dehydrogenase (short-subunit alcohol dehydrogenase family)